MKTTLTIRHLIDTVNLQDVYTWINKKDSTNAAACDRPTLKQTTNAYSGVIKELSAIRKSKPYKYTICVKLTKSDEEYIDVCFLNSNYIAPKKGLKPWGCRKNETPPPGYYNVNDDCHNKEFGFGFQPWSNVIDTPIVIEKSILDTPLHGILGEILWELTFYGWTQKIQKREIKKIKGRLDKAIKDLDKGNYTELKFDKNGKILNL